MKASPHNSINNMRHEYVPQKLEPKWQKVWDKSKIYQTDSPSKKTLKKSAGNISEAKKKFYALIEFPFPSGSGLHVGHIRSNTAMDVIARKRRREGYDVLYPIGWDAFGLPTENYAIKTGIHPKIVTKQNSDNFRRQLKSLGFSFDWSREINTSDPAYYRWTQWIFLQFFKKGLAYKKKMVINWCPKDLIGLANEEVIDGCCERCGTPVEKREKEQWMLAITKYADRLDRDLDTVDFLPQIKMQQRNWIGKSEGAEIDFKIMFEKGGQPGVIPVFTTRPETLFGVTYIVFAPEHPWVTLALDDQHKGVLSNADLVREYVKAARLKDDIKRTDATAEKTGVELKGVKAINPATGKEIPIWVADYVLADYGTGAVMAVPAHDERDHEFARIYHLPEISVLEPVTGETRDTEEFRKSIVALVYDPKNKKYISINWGNKNGGHLLVGGGLADDANEDLITCARREIAEETGYVNVKYISKTGKVHHHYEAHSKGVNRYIQAVGLFFELENDEKRAAQLEKDEQGKFTVEWLSLAELQNKIKDSLHRYVLDFFTKSAPYTGEGILVHSGAFDGQTSQESKKKITDAVGGRWVTKFKLRDWVFSRQRYWGEPIPLVHCETCGTVPLPDKDLPLVLPNVKNYKPTENGESPLASISKWVNIKCPQCKGKATRETDTMPNWAGSSWYYLRYTDPKNKKNFADRASLDYWTPVDWYNGGMEHTTLHLLYSRFWHKFLFDCGLVPTSEPYQKRTSHGLILASGGEKMSKSKGNVTNPDTIVATAGADALRLYEMFMGPFDQAIAWDENGIVGCRRFIEKVWKLQYSLDEAADARDADEATRRAVAIDPALETLIHKTIKKVSDDIEGMYFNTAVSALMILANEFEKKASTGMTIRREYYALLLQLLAPFAPHVTEELWHIYFAKKSSIHTMPWPIFDPLKIQDAVMRIAVQINGKTRALIECAPTTSEDDIREKALALDEIKKWMQNDNIVKVVYIKGRLINFVVAQQSHPKT